MENIRKLNSIWEKYTHFLRVNQGAVDVLIHFCKGLSSRMETPWSQIPAVNCNHSRWDSTWTMGYPNVSMTSWDSQWNEIYLVKAINWTQDLANFNIRPIWLRGVSILLLGSTYLVTSCPWTAINWSYVCWYLSNIRSGQELNRLLSP